MSTFEFEGGGHYLPARIVVVADCIESAQRLAEDWMTSRFLNPASLKLVKETPLEPDVCRVVYGYNGDY